MKKFFVILLILIVAAGIALFFGQGPIKKLIKKHPQLNSLAQKGYALFTHVGGSSLGNLNENEDMTEAYITIDFDNELGQYKKFWGGIGLGSFNEGVLKPHNRAFFKLVGEANKAAEVFTHVNPRGTFSDRPPAKKGKDIGAHVYRENDDGTIDYNWQIFDRVIDTLLENDLTPLVSLTFMPDDLALKINKRNPWHKACVSPPKDYDRWQDLIFETVNHLKQRYGEQELKDWFFEVWNEPDLARFFWVLHPDQESYPRKSNNLEYFKLYDYSVAGAMAAYKNIRIGGPAIAGDIAFFVRDWLPHCTEGENYATGARGSEVRVLSRHAYGKVEESILPKIVKFVDIAKKNGEEIFEQSHFLISETGPSTRIKSWLNNRYVAVWIVKEVDGIFYLGDKLGEEYVPDKIFFWTNPVPANFGNHFGLVTALGSEWNPSPDALIKRPAFNAYDALSKLGPIRLKAEGTGFGDPINAIATKSTDGRSLQILVYHMNERDYENRLSATYPVYLTFTNLPFIQFKTELYKIDENHSNGYTQWRKLGRPKNPDKNQLKLLQKKDDLELVEMNIESINNQRFEKVLEIQNNSVSLLILTELP